MSEARVAETLTAEHAIERIVDITQDWNLAEIDAVTAMRRILEALEEHSGEAGNAQVEHRSMTELLDEIQRLTRYQGRVELRTMYLNLSSPAHTSRPMATFRVPDPDEPDYEVAAPCYAALADYGGLEGIGRTWEEALRQIVDGLKAQESAR